MVEPGRGIIGSLIESGRAELINDTAADPRAVQIPGTETRADERLMVVPLLAGETVQGAMAVWRNGGKPFDGARAGLPGGAVAPGDDRAAERAAVQRGPAKRSTGRPRRRKS